MKLLISVSGDNPEKELLNLKKFLENSKTEEIESVELTRTNAEKGEMGAGIIGSLTAVLAGSISPLSKLSDLFSKYITSYRTEIILRNEFGDELVLNTKKIDDNGIKYLVDKFLDKSKEHKSIKKTVKKPIKKS
jgi:hypothetical protein